MIVIIVMVMVMVMKMMMMIVMMMMMTVQGMLVLLMVMMVEAVDIQVEGNFSGYPEARCVQGFEVKNQQCSRHAGSVGAPYGHSLSESQTD